MVGRWVAVVVVVSLALLGCGADPAEPLGACESFPAKIDVNTVDGSASIGSVETRGVCMTSTGWCEVTGEAGRSPACTSVTVTSILPGSCDLTISSVGGQRVTRRVEFKNVVTDTRCQTSVGQVIENAPVLVADPLEVKVAFTASGGR